MSDETKFPEDDDTLYNKGHPQYEPTIYDLVEVNDWFQRCIKDFPKSDGSYIFKGIEYTIPIDGVAVQKWFTKWFSQFTTKGDMSGY